MSYRIIILISLLLVLTHHNYTSITLVNCPAQFNVTAYNTTTDTAASTIGPFVYAGFTSSSSQDRVVEIVTTGDKQKLS